MARKIRLFVSSPSDVPRERELVDYVASEIERLYPGELSIDVFRWERAALDASANFQEGINRAIRPDEVDIAVFIVWQRLGSPLGSQFVHPETDKKYSSGTEYEFDMMLRAAEANQWSRPRVLFYVKEDKSKTVQVAPATVRDDSARKDIEQRELLSQFLETHFTDQSDGSNVRALHRFPEPITFERILRQHILDVLKTLLQDDPSGIGRRLESTWKGNPFRGLDAFNIADRAIFCGRDSIISEAIDSLNGQQKAGTTFLMLVGASGSGKSSLARAGIAPRILQGTYTPGASFWRTATMYPSDHASAGDLCARLSHALLLEPGLPEMRTSERRTEEIAEILRDSPLAVCVLIEDALVRAARVSGTDPDEARLLITIDQFEEIFTDETVTRSDRELFIRSIAIFARSRRIWIIATVRSDFYPQIQTLPELVELKKERGSLDVLPPTASELRQIITYPAHAAGLEFEIDKESMVRLEDRILDDALEQGGGAILPLLQFALERLYESRSPDGVLAHASYRKLGGVAGTLRSHAELVFGGLSQEGRESLSDVLSHLVSISDDGHEVRQRASREVFDRCSHQMELVDAFVSARLFAADRDVHGTPIVTIAHEALLKHWRRAATWVTENREFLHSRKNLETSAAIWDERGRDSEFLLPVGRPLSEAEELVATRREALSQNARELVADSLKEANRRRLLAALTSGRDYDEVARDLFEISEDQYNSVMEEVLSSPHEEVRQRAASVVGGLPTPSTLVHLGVISGEDDSVSVRREASTSLLVCDDVEVYHKIVENAGGKSTSTFRRSLVHLRVAADAVEQRSRFEEVYSALPGAVRLRVSIGAKIQRLASGWSTTLIATISALLLSTVFSALFKIFPGAFNYALGQPEANAATAVFHAMLATVFWGGMITVAVSLHWIVMRRQWERKSYLRPFGGLLFGAAGGLISSICLNAIIVFVIGESILLDIAWTTHKRDGEFSMFVRDIFFETRMFWPYIILGTGLGVGMACTINGLLASSKWKTFLESQSQLNSRTVLSAVRSIFWLVIRYSAPIPLVMFVAIGLAFASAATSPAMDIEETANPDWIQGWQDVAFGGMAGHHDGRNEVRDYVREWKASRAGLGLAIFFDAATQMIGGFFCAIGLGLALVIAKFGVRIDPIRQ